MEAPIEEISIIMNPSAAMIIPIPIFFGVDGSIPFLFSHANAPITGKVSATMKRGLNDWKTSGEIEFCGPNGVNVIPEHRCGVKTCQVESCKHRRKQGTKLRRSAWFLL